MDVLEKIYNIHDLDCNQQYDGTLPYSFHLKTVVGFARKYFPIFMLGKTVSLNVQEELKRIIFVVAAGHDLIEDARMTYNDVRDFLRRSACFVDTQSPYTAADAIYACTEEKGKTRAERHSDKFLVELSGNRLAVYVKLCDVMANVLYSKLTGSSMLEAYKKEFPRLKEFLYIKDEYEQLWNDLEKLF